MDETVNKILTHFESLKQERDPWARSVEEVLKYIVPGRASMEVTTDTKDYTIDSTSKNGTARASSYLMANGLLGNVCSQRSKWFKITPDLPKQNNINGLAQWLEDVQDTFYHMMSTGNFYANAWQSFLDSSHSGLASMIIEANKIEKTFNFRTFAPKGSYIATNSRNIVDTYFHHYTLTARDIVEEYEKDGNLPKDFLDQAKNKPYQRYEIIHAIFPRKDRLIYKLDNINMAYASVHVLKGRKIKLRESGYESFPMAIFRYFYDSEEVYPHSPSLDGAGDIRMLNRISTDVSKVSQMAANPGHFVPAEMYNDFEIKPDFKIKAYDMNRLPVASVLGQNYPIGKDREEMYQQIVKEHYFTNFFMMLAASEGNNMTATEVLERQGEKATVIGGMVSRLTQEFLDPIFDRMFVIAARNRWIPDPPEELLASGSRISIDYLGPLAQAQQRFLKLQGPLTSLQNFLPILEAYPEMRDILKPYDLGKHLLVEGGMPQSLLKDKDQYDEEQQAKAQQQQQMMEAQMMEQQANAMNKGSKAPEEGSPTEALLAGQQ